MQNQIALAVRKSNLEIRGGIESAATDKKPGDPAKTARCIALDYVWADCVRADDFLADSFFMIGNLNRGFYLVAPVAKCSSISSSVFPFVSGRKKTAVRK